MACPTLAIPRCDCTTMNPGSTHLSRHDEGCAYRTWFLARFEAAATELYEGNSGGVSQSAEDAMMVDAVLDQINAELYR